MSKTSRNFVVAYVLLVGIPILALVGMLRWGNSLTAPVSAPPAPFAQAAPGTPATPYSNPIMPNLFVLVLQIAVILAICRIVGMVFRWIHQPRVVGEMFAGILLGPSFLGWMSPGISNYLFPATSLGFLSALSQIGIIIFMFLVGLGINPKELKSHGHAAVLISHVSITAPFVLAGLLSLYLYPKLSDSSVSFTSFALFMGAAMSVTAFPVLARILNDRDLLSTPLGTVSIACAAVDDITGWCILAYIVALIHAAHESKPLWMTFAGLLGIGLVGVYVLRPLLQNFERLYSQRGELSESMRALLLFLVLVAALATQWLGLHLLFGAFLMGALMPKDHKFIRYIVDRCETVTVTLLLPLFFAFTGLRTNIGLVNGREMWIFCGLIIGCAILGKLGGSMAAGVLSGMSVRESAGLGALMNTRGLMALVILDIGLDIKVISPALFSMMVLMALVTTFLTTPLLEIVCPERVFRARVVQASSGPELASMGLDSGNSSAA